MIGEVWNQTDANNVVDYRLVVQRDILLSENPPSGLFCVNRRILLARPQQAPPRILTNTHEKFMASTTNPTNELSITDLQRHIHQMYYDKDVARGVDGTFMWLMEEIGELASALRGDDKQNLAEEFADVIAWLATIANVAEVDLNAALLDKYGRGCPGCGRLVCECPDSEKP